MIEIMEKMNHYRELSISNHNDKIELIKKNDEQYNKHMGERGELLNEKKKLKKQIKTLTAAKAKKIRVKGTKKELLNYLEGTEEELSNVLANSWCFSDKETMEDILKSYENGEIKLRPVMLKKMREMVTKVFPYL